MDTITKLTRKGVSEYLKTPTKCPYCGDSDIAGGPVEIEYREARQEISCYACGQQWTDVYVLHDIEEGG